jgi:S-adenosylmethionine decarboxylase
MTEYKTIGQHVMTDAWGIDFDVLNDIDFLQEHMKKAAEIIGATILTTEGWKFEPAGVTVVVILSESHLSIHTYPEKGFAALDGYTCGERIDPEPGIEYLLSVLTPAISYSQKVIRGTGELMIDPLSKKNREQKND